MAHRGHWSAHVHAVVRSRRHRPVARRPLHVVAAAQDLLLPLGRRDPRHLRYVDQLRQWLFNGSPIDVGGRCSVVAHQKICNNQ